jgi:hypothetical protein
MNPCEFLTRILRGNDIISNVAWADPTFNLKRPRAKIGPTFSLDESISKKKFFFTSIFYLPSFFFSCDFGGDQGHSQFPPKPVPEHGKNLMCLEFLMA